MLNKVVRIFIFLAVFGFFGSIFLSLVTGNGSGMYAAYFIVLGVIVVIGFLAIASVIFDLFKRKVTVREAQMNEKHPSKILIVAGIVSVLVLSVFYLGMSGKIDGFLLFLQQYR